MAVYEVIDPQRAWEYLEQIGISRPTELSLDLLNSIARELSYKLPFQNLNILSVPVEDRRPLSGIAVDERMFKYSGGVCIDLNIFLYRILKAIGYDVCIKGGGLMTEVKVHVCVIASNVVNAGDRFLVDIGFGFPTLRAIPLDFDHESPVYTDSFVQYKYLKQGNRYTRLHEPKACIIRPFEYTRPDGWVTTHWFSEDSIEPDAAIDLLWRNVLCDPQCPPLLFFRINGFCDRKFCAVKGYSYYEEDPAADGGPAKLIKKDFPDRESVLRYVSIKFPAIDPGVAKLALDYHDKYLAPALKAR